MVVGALARVSTVHGRRRRNLIITADGSVEMDMLPGVRCSTAVAVPVVRTESFIALSSSSSLCDTQLLQSFSLAHHTLLQTKPLKIAALYEHKVLHTGSSRIH